MLVEGTAAPPSDINLRCVVAPQVVTATIIAAFRSLEALVVR
jgi:hypothetical protein